VAVRLAALGPQDLVLAITMHHIVFDGWSTPILAQELRDGYVAAVDGGTADLPELPVAYSDYAWWEQERLAADEPALLAYWQRALAGTEELRLPADRPGSGVGGPSATVRQPIAAPTYTRLAALARTEHTTPFTVALAGYVALLHRYTHQTGFVVAMPVAGRADVAVEPLIGCFINTVCVPARVHPGQTFRDLVGATRDSLVGAVAHQALPFDHLVRHLSPHRGSDRNPLFRAFCSGVDRFPPPLGLPGVQDSLAVPEYQLSRFDLNATFLLDPDRPLLQLDYALGIFDQDTGERLARHLGVLLDWAVTRPDRPVGELPFLLPRERKAMLALLNNAAADPRGADR
jgi:hypothetical protein